MKIIIIYATYSGSTQIASRIIRDRLTEKNMACDYRLAADTDIDQLAGFDLIVICTPTWDHNGQEGQPHEDLIRIINHPDKEKLKGKKFALMGLGDSSYAHFCGSIDVLTSFVGSVNGEIVIPPLKIDGFFYNQDTHNAAILAWTDNLIAVVNG